MNILGLIVLIIIIAIIIFIFIVSIYLKVLKYKIAKAKKIFTNEYVDYYINQEKLNDSFHNKCKDKFWNDYNNRHKARRNK